MSDDVQILVGDCRATLGHLAAGSVRCVVTSPPYNLGASLSAREHPHAARGLDIARWGYEADKDALPEDEYQAQQVAVLDALWDVTTPDASIFYVHTDRLSAGVSLSPRTWLERSRWLIRAQVTWDQGQTHNHQPVQLVPLSEWVFWLKKPTRPDRRETRHWKLGRYAEWGTVWRIPPTPPTFAPWHPCPFPPALAERCILLGSHPGDTILDPYAGAATTLHVARQLGRAAIGIERQARYVDLARADLARQPLLLPVVDRTRIGGTQPALFTEEVA